MPSKNSTVYIVSNLLFCHALSSLYTSSVMAVIVPVLISLRITSLVDAVCQYNYYLGHINKEFVHWALFPTFCPICLATVAQMFHFDLWGVISTSPYSVFTLLLVVPFSRFLTPCDLSSLMCPLLLPWVQRSVDVVPMELKPHLLHLSFCHQINQLLLLLKIIKIECRCLCLFTFSLPLSKLFNLLNFDTLF